MKYPSIISPSEILWDLFPRGERFGVAPASFICHAVIQGSGVSMISEVGVDQHGRDVTRTLKGYGIDVNRMQIASDALTGTVSVQLDNDCKPTLAICEGSPWGKQAWNDDVESRVSVAGAVDFGTLGQRSDESRATISQVVKMAQDVGVPDVFDTNLRPPLSSVTLIRETVRITSLLETGNLDMVFMTRGADGSVPVTLGNLIAQGGIPAAVIDQVGAGGSFTAAFLDSDLCYEPREQSLGRDNEIAAVTCTHSGAVPTELSTVLARRLCPKH
ncbi:MAG: PfkB family carbohydrate kinase [Rubripirellula sp.]|nr:PfkB family carbohydrate kinase [Rubripirellula sp.]